MCETAEYWHCWALKLGGVEGYGEKGGWRGMENGQAILKHFSSTLFCGCGFWVLARVYKRYACRSHDTFCRCDTGVVGVMFNVVPFFYLTRLSWWSLQACIRAHCYYKMQLTNHKNVYAVT